MVAADLRLLPVEAAHFHRAAELVLDATSAVRVGDALHVACAEAVGAKYIATLDEVLGCNASGSRSNRLRCAAHPDSGIKRPLAAERRHEGFKLQSEGSFQLFAPGRKPTINRHLAKQLAEYGTTVR